VSRLGQVPEAEGTRGHAGQGCRLSLKLQQGERYSQHILIIIPPQ
jgi:hypothetical protein